MKKGLLFTLAGLALTYASCGNRNGLYPVSGHVTYQREPAVGATVFLRRTGGDPLNEPMIMGLVQEDGAFTLVCGSLGNGAPPGQYDVLIEWKRSSNQTRGLTQRVPDKLKGRYADPVHPRLHAVIKAENNCLPPFELMDEDHAPDTTGP